MALSSKEQQRLRTRYGSWALVTGASSGIGRAIATELAKAGFNLILVARRADILQSDEARWRAAHGIEVRVVAADLATADGIAQVQAATQGLDWGLFVGSAGFGTSGEFLQASIAEELEMLHVNAEALLALTHHAARAFAQQKRGGMVLLGSLVGFQGVPYAAHYAATKAYVQTLAEGLAVELRPHGIDVLAAAPGPVRSGFEARADMRMGAALEANAVAAPILRALGRKGTVWPGWLSKLLMLALWPLPRWAKTRVLAKIMGGMTQHQRPAAVSSHP